MDSLHVRTWAVIQHFVLRTLLHHGARLPGQRGCRHLVLDRKIPMLLLFTHLPLIHVDGVESVLLDNSRSSLDRALGFAVHIISLEVHRCRLSLSSSGLFQARCVDFARGEVAEAERVVRDLRVTALLNFVLERARDHEVVVVFRDLSLVALPWVLFALGFGLPTVL